VGGVLQAEGIECEEADILCDALADYATLGVDFADAVMARAAQGSGAPLCYTFDTRHFTRLGIPNRQPG
jgi:predicted nucleic-acid-binding protein